MAGSALTGPGISGGDITMVAGSSLLTSTSQWSVVGFLASSTSDFTALMANTTTVQPVGVCLTKLSASAEAVCTVRLLGIAKVKCNDTVSAGHFVVSSGEGLAAGLQAGLTATAVSTTSHINTLGIALQAGSTNDYISIFVNPQLVVKTY